MQRSAAWGGLLLVVAIARGSARLGARQRSDARRPHVHAARRFHAGTGRRAAAGRTADRGRLRRPGPAVRRRVVGHERPVAKQLVDKPHRIVRLEDTDGDGVFDQAHRVRRQDDASRGADVARRFALRRGTAEHLEADRYRRRRRGRPARRVVPGQDAHRLRQRPAWAVSRARRLDLLVQRGVRRANLRARQASRRSSPGRRTSSVPGPTARASSR